MMKLKSNIVNFLLALLSLHLLYKSVFAQEEIWAKITAGATRKKIRIVIPNFNLLTPADYLQQISSDIKNTVISDLEYSLYFEIISADTIKPLSSKKIDWSYWQKTTAQVLAIGEIQTKKKTNLTIILYDIFTRKQIGTKSYDVQDNIRWLAHRIADDIIKLLTGEDGICQTKIAFSLKKDKTKELAVVDYDGYNLQQLTSSGELKLFPDWSPNANKIAFCSYAQNNLNIYAYDLNQKKAELIISKDGLNTTPAYSPDGKKIAASLSFEGNPEIYIMDANGKNLKRLTYSPAIDISPTWSPTGQELAFVSDRTGTPQIYLINIDGTNLRRLTFQGSYNTSPAWSPRGDLIAYVARESDGTNQIYVIDVTGNNYMRLTNLGNNEEPTWSADGLHLTFSSNRTGRYEIYTMHWNGTGQRQITNYSSGYSPTWSKRLTK
ncbi:MAG: Tol-Pal system beta propeller repeat protein TolB [candidate division WOR-3 bacterium]